MSNDFTTWTIENTYLKGGKRKGNILASVNDHSSRISPSTVHLEVNHAFEQPRIWTSV